MTDTHASTAASTAVETEAEHAGPSAPDDHEPLTDSLIEDISIDGMCGVY
ncbi:mycofactocin precursor MftA [Streptomyces flaveus]|uniref:Mycofactocin n=1 Tax=Streptomyces flaveus TaxID=66370 RepID=A0A917VBG9_9ACTN|nr:mycofactocin precursor MftA [Streptomyces flaveus]GGK59739.1 hypothetical protein GCM10010094_20160 [Streptomyces flaveus]